MRDVLATGARWRSEGAVVGRAVLVRAGGSAPFEVGSTLVVADDGRIAGSVSAGCVEGAAVEAVTKAQRGQYRELVRYGVTDERAAEVGLTCGGIIDVLIEPDLPPDVLAALAEGGALAVATPLPVGPEPAEVARVVLEDAGIRLGSLGDPGADAELAGLARDALATGVSRTVRVGERDIYVEVMTPARLVIIGAGDIAVFLVRLASALGFLTVVIDARGSFLTRERFPDADALLLGWADELADRAGIGPSAHVVALAHEPRFDDPALIVALRRGAAYIGALGSRATHATRLARLRDAGLDDRELSRIHAPIGLDLGGHTASDIALGILAEIVAEENRRRASSRAREAFPAPG